VLAQPGLEGGVYQWSGLEAVTKWDIVRMIGAETGLTVEHLTEQAEQGPGPVARPRDVTLERGRLEARGISHHRPLREGIMEVLRPHL
jgi:dTDP-4-dehydrorhamnose reductase